MPKGYPKDGRKPGNAEALARWRKSFRKGDGRASDAGKKGGETARALREFRTILTEQITAPATNREGNPVLRADGEPATVQDQLARRLIASVMAGDMTAYAMMLKLLGQYPEEHIRATLAQDAPLIVDDIAGASAEREKAGDGA